MECVSKPCAQIDDTYSLASRFRSSLSQFMAPTPASASPLWDQKLMRPTMAAHRDQPRTIIATVELTRSDTPCWPPASLVKARQSINADLAIRLETSLRSHNQDIGSLHRVLVLEQDSKMVYSCLRASVHPSKRDIVLTSGILAILDPTDSDMPFKNILLKRMRKEFRTRVSEELSVLLQDSLRSGRPGIESLLLLCRRDWKLQNSRSRLDLIQRYM
jgi:hypothetical protein